MKKPIKDVYISKEIAIYDHTNGENDVVPEFEEWTNKMFKKGYAILRVEFLHGEKIYINGKYVNGSYLFVIMYHVKSVESLSLLFNSIK